MTFMREFQRRVRHREFVSSLSQEDDLAGGVSNLLLKSDNNLRGTKEIGAATADGKELVCLLVCLHLQFFLKRMKPVDLEGENHTTTLKKSTKKCKLNSLNTITYAIRILEHRRLDKFLKTR